MKIGLAIPTYNEYKTLLKVLPILSKSGFEIVIADDSKKGEKELIRYLCEKYGAYMIYHHKRMGLGQSWKEAIIMAWYTLNCNVVICMDVDHNYRYIPAMVKKLQNADVVVGCEKQEWSLPRKVTKFLANNLLGLNLKHPTCGFIAWRSPALEFMPWKLVKSKGDVFHVELLYWAKRLGMKIDEQEFDVLEGVKHRYSIKRYLRWLWEFFRLLRLKYIWFWRWRNL